MTTNPTRDQIAALRIDEDCPSEKDPGFNAGLDAAYRAILAAQAPQEEPGAYDWLQQGLFGKEASRRLTREHPEASDRASDIKPLYATPPSPQPTDNTALVEALRPFVRMIEVSDWWRYTDDAPVFTQGHADDRRSITVGDFLRAKAALARAQQPAPDVVAEAAIREVYEAGWQVDDTFCDLEDGAEMAAIERLRDALTALRNEMPEVDRPAIASQDKDTNNGH